MVDISSTKEYSILKYWGKHTYLAERVLKITIQDVTCFNQSSVLLSDTFSLRLIRRIKNLGMDVPLDVAIHSLL